MPKSSFLVIVSDSLPKSNTDYLNWNKLTETGIFVSCHFPI